MDMEAGKTLTNEEVIRELLELLKKNAMKEQANAPINSPFSRLIFWWLRTLSEMSRQ